MNKRQLNSNQILAKIPYQKIVTKNISSQQFSTNNVFRDEHNKVIYLPGFMRLKFKNFNDLNIGGLSALLNGEIVFVINYGQAFQNIPAQKKNRIIQDYLMKKVILLFARDNAIKLTNDEKENKQKDLDIKVNHDRKRHEIKYILKKIFKLYLDSQVFLTPFEIINGILEVTVQSVSIQMDQNDNKKDKKSSKWKIQFNLQDHPEIKQKVKFANWGTFGNYDLAETRIGALYTNYRVSQAKDFKLTVQQRISQQKKRKRESDLQDGNEKLLAKVQQYLQNQKIRKQASRIYQKQAPLRITLPQKDVKIESFHYAYFNIPLYKFPLSALITIFMPLFFLDVLNFGILFQDSGLSDRIAAIATLVLAFAALIPTIRSQIPPNPRITLIQILVYVQTIPTLLAIIQSLNVYYLKQDPFILNWAKDAFFWIAFCISVSTFIAIVVGLFLHYCKWYKQYNDVNDRKEKNRFERTDWQNIECDRYFGQNYSQQLDGRNGVIKLTKKDYERVYSLATQKLKGFDKKDQIINKIR